MELSNTHHIIVFGSNDSNRTAIISFLTNSNQCNIAINNDKFIFWNSPDVVENSLEHISTEIYQLLFQLKNIPYITCGIFCVKTYSDVSQIRTYTRILSSLYNSNLICIILNKRLLESIVVNEMTESSNMDFLCPVYRTNCLKINSNNYLRMSILHNLKLTKNINISDVVITKNIFIVQAEINHERKEKEKLKQYISRRSIKNKEFENISDILYNFLVEKSIIISRIDCLKQTHHYRSTDHPVLVSTRIGKPSVGATLNYESDHDIESLKAYGMSYSILNQSGKNLKIRIDSVIDPRDKYCTFTVFTTRKSFYQEDNTSTEELINSLNCKLKNVNDRIQFIYSELNIESKKLFNGIFMHYITNYSFKTKLYFTIDEALAYKNQYIASDSYLKYEDIDINDVFENITNEIKRKDLSYVILKNCKLNNEIFLNLLNQIQGTKIIYFSIEHNSSINDECIFDAMRIIVNTNIQMLNLNDTNVSKSGKESIDKFFIMLNGMSSVYVDQDDRDKMLIGLKDKIDNNEQIFRDTMRLNKK